MNSFKKSPLIIAVLAVLLLGFYTFEFGSSEATLFELPDFISNTDISPASKKPVGTLADFNDAIVDVATKTRQAVVSIEVTQTQENPLSRYFNIPEEELERQGLGSGVVASRDGYILTNNHVVEGASSINVRHPNGNVYEGEVVGTDPQTDIAVVKIDAENLTALAFGDSDQTRVGELVLAIGSPLSETLAQSVSMGIISAKKRTIGILLNSQGYEQFIQTDAAINPGNSGGALVNMDGELIGINTAIASASRSRTGGGSDGIGFAVPSNMARYVMESLIEDGEVRRGFVGISYGGQVDATMAKALGLDSTRGVIIGTVSEGGPADEAGLQEGDVIVSVNGSPVSDWLSFRSTIGSSEPGETVALGIIRNSEQRQVEITLDEQPESLRASNPNNRQQQPQQQQDIQRELGFTIQDLTPRYAQQLNLPSDTEGALVSEVTRNGQAARQGLSRGDVITHVSGTRVMSASELQDAFETLIDDGEQYVRLRILRPSQDGDPIVQFVALEL